MRSVCARRLSSIRLPYPVGSLGSRRIRQAAAPLHPTVIPQRYALRIAQWLRLMIALSDKRALVVGVANEQSVAWGVAEALHRAGAMLAITYLDEEAEPRVRPLAERVYAPIIMPLDVTKAEDEDLLF